MATLKRDGYSFRFMTGVAELDEADSDQLVVTGEELVKAIAHECLADKLFKRVLKWREEQHKKMVASIPGVEG